MHVLMCYVVLNVFLFAVGIILSSKAGSGAKTANSTGTGRLSY